EQALQAALALGADLLHRHAGDVTARQGGARRQHHFHVAEVVGALGAAAALVDALEAGAVGAVVEAGDLAALLQAPDLLLGGVGQRAGRRQAAAAAGDRRAGLVAVGVVGIVGEVA